MNVELKETLDRFIF